MFSNRDLVNQLLTHAGMIMEDAHSAAVLDEGDLSIVSRIAAVRCAGAAVVALADAADALWRHAAE